jgi:aryl-alcohol dehydrogenase-like predicted oxidoreductase
MNLRRLGKSELRISPLVFGAWAIGGWMWGGSNEKDAIEAIHAALDAGINTIDTAAIYGMGYSEELVGRAIQGKREQVVLATKCGRSTGNDVGAMPFETQDLQGRAVTVRSNSRPEKIIRECEESLQRLRTDVIDLYQIHWPDTTFPIADAVGTLARLKEQGKIRAIGVSNYSAEQLREAADAVQIDSLQPPYSLLQRGIESSQLPLCRERGISVLCYSPLERGLLTGTVSPSRIFPEGDHRNTHKFFTPENRRRVLDALERIRPIAERHRASFAQLIIAWTIARPGITAALVGARNAEQARHNAGALELRLSAEESETLQTVFERCSAEMSQ